MSDADLFKKDLLHVFQSDNWHSILSEVKFIICICYVINEGNLCFPNKIMWFDSSIAGKVY